MPCEFKHQRAGLFPKCHFSFGSARQSVVHYAQALSPACASPPSPSGSCLPERVWSPAVSPWGPCVWIPSPGSRERQWSGERFQGVNLKVIFGVCARSGISTASRWSYCEMSPLSFSARALFSWHSLVLRLLCSSIWAWMSLSVPWKWVVISFLFRSSSLHRCRVSSCRQTSIFQQHWCCIFISKIRTNCHLSVLSLLNKFPGNEKNLCITFAVSKSASWC